MLHDGDIMYTCLQCNVMSNQLYMHGLLPGATSWLSKDDVTLKCMPLFEQSSWTSCCVYHLVYLLTLLWMKDKYCCNHVTSFKQADNMVVTRLSHPCCQDGCHLSVTTMLTNLLQPCNNLVTTCWPFQFQVSDNYSTTVLQPCNNFVNILVTCL